MKKNVLIVDDQPGIRLLLQDIFIEEGFNVKTAKTGKEALDNVRASTFDLILLDYRLPIMNAVEVLEQMDRENIQVPVILMTGLIEEMEEKLTRKTNMLTVIGKPFDIDDICELADKMVTTQQSQT